MRRVVPWLPVIGIVTAVALIAGLVYLGWTGRAASTDLAELEERIATLEAAQTAAQHGKPPAPGPGTTVQPEHPRLVPATDLPGDGWAQQFLGLSESDPKRLAGIADRIVSDDEQKGMEGNLPAKLAKIRKSLAAGTKLTKSDRSLLRTVLVACIADHAAQDGDPVVKLDGTFGGIPKPLLQRVKTHFGVVSRPGTDEQTADFEAEVILRWAKEQGL